MTGGEGMPAGPQAEDFAPVQVVEVELSHQLPSLPGGTGDLGIRYRAAQCLVRLHRKPLGLVFAELPSRGLDANALAELIWAQLGGEIAQHMREDGMPALKRLGTAGIPGIERPPCRVGEEAFLRSAPFVSVVIPTRNRPGSIGRTVAKVAAATYPSERREVIVVDNGSGSDAMVDRADLDAPEDLTLRVVREPAPGGSNARNRGLADADGEIVVFADDDVDVDVDWLATLVRPFTEDPRVGAVAGVTIPNELETPSQVWFEGFGGFIRGFARRDYDIDDPPPDRPLFPFTVGDFGSGANSAFRRDLLRNLGGFDSALGTATPTLAGEDIEAVLRVLLAGHRVIYEPAAIVHHEHQREYEQFQRRVWGYGVGLTACLSKAMVDNPRRLVPLLFRKLPGGIAYALSPGSAKNENKQSDHPPELTRLELRGMAYGPLAYARSRWRQRRRRRAMTRRGSSPPPKSLRVLIVTDSHPPLIGGANRSVELLSRHLVGLGHGVAVATAWQKGLPAFEESNGVQVHRIRDLSSRMRWISEDPYKHNPPPFPDPEGVLELRRLIRDFKPDLVHAYGWLAHSTAAALPADEIPLLLSARDYGNICPVRTLVRNGKGICDGPGPAKCIGCAANTYGAAKGSVATASVLGVAGPLLRRRVTAIHSVSHYVAGQMERHLRVPNAHSVVIPNFHEDTSGQPVDEEMLARLPQEPFILYVGAFRQIKGIEDLFAAYAQLDDPPPLVLAGTQATDTPQPFPPAGVIAIEDVPHATVMAMWERAMFGVLPTRAPEALGNVVHEAMSKGRAMIGTRPGGQEDMIEHGKTGLLVPSWDPDALTGAMGQLIGDAELRHRLGERARERAQLFTPEVIVPKLERLYYDTIAHFAREQT